MSFQRAFFSSARASVLTAMIACGGSRGSDLFDAPGGGSGEPDAGDAGEAPLDATVHADTGGGPDADAGPDPVDAGPPDVVVVKDANLPDTNPPPTDPGIACGATDCKPGSAVCCRLGTAPNATFACTTAAGCQQVAALTIPCDDAEDCKTTGHPNQVCCLDANPQTGSAQGVQCRLPKDCGASYQTTMCDPTVTDACPDGGTCRESKTTLPGYWICIQ